jgi:transcriptional regulator with XRE-family HTH domain
MKLNDLMWLMHFVKGTPVMTLFINNFNSYIDHMKIKQIYLSKLCGIEKNKLSRILNGLQDETGADMERLADAVGKRVDYFLTESFELPPLDEASQGKIAFYAGNPSKKQEIMANDLVEMIENIDQVLSAKKRFENIGRI